MGTDPNSPPVPPRDYTEDEQHEIFLLDYWPGLKLLKKLQKCGSDDQKIKEVVKDDVRRSLVRAGAHLTRNAQFRPCSCHGGGGHVARIARVQLPSVQSVEGDGAA